MAFPLASIIFIYNGTVVLWYAIRSFGAWKKTGNAYSLMFFRMELGVAITEYLLGFPTLISPESSAINGFFYLLIFFPLFLGLGETLKFVLIELGYLKTKMAIAFLLPLIAIIFFVAHLSAFPNPYVDSYGLIHWDVDFPYDVIWAFLLGAVTIIPALFLFFAKVPGKGAFMKKILMGAAFFFGGIGGIGTIIFDETFLPLFFFYISQFMGFSFLLAVFLVDLLVEKGEHNE